MTSTLPPLVQAVSGSIGSASANTLTYPLDLVTTRLQLQSQSKSSGLRGAIRILRAILRKHGLQHLYTGLGTDTGATLLSNFFYFYFYAGLRYLLTRRRITLSPKKGAIASQNILSLSEEVLLGFIAGVASRVVSTPLSIVTLRLQVERENDEEDAEEEEETSVTEVIKKIYDEQGVWGFWRGFKTTTLLSLNPALTLALFQVFRRLLARTSGTINPSPKHAFLGAAVSNSIATILLYPLILAKTRLQATSATSLREVLRDAYSGKGRSLSLPAPAIQSSKGVPGVAALYQGLEMQILKGFLSQGVTFLVKGRVEQLIVEVYERRRGGGGLA